MGERYSTSDFLNSKFYQLSKELFQGKYKKLSNNERVLYSILKDRFELSVKNGWVDKENNIFFFFQQENLSEECCMSLRTVQRVLQGLIDTQLIESVRQGQNQPNRLYLLKPEQSREVSKNMEKDPDNPVNMRTRQNDISGHAKLTHPDTPNWRTIYTKNNNTNITKSSSMGEVEKEEDWKEKIDFTSVEKEVPKDVMEKVCEVLDELKTESASTEYSINGKMLPRDEVRKKIYSSIDTKSFITVVKSIMSAPGTIKRVRPYIISCFCNYSAGDLWDRRGRPENKINNSFNNFQQNDYDFEEIERKLLKNN